MIERYSLAKMKGIWQEEFKFKTYQTKSQI